MWWDYLKAVVLIVLIIGAAYYVTKLVAKKGSGLTAKGTEIKLLGSRSFGRDKHLVITEIGEKVYVLGMTAQNITLIDTIAAEEFSTQQAEPEMPQTSGFAKEFLERLKGNNNP